MILVSTLCNQSVHWSFRYLLAYTRIYCREISGSYPFFDFSWHYESRNSSLKACSIKHRDLIAVPKPRAISKMFSSLSLFSNIDCPVGKDCSLSNCLFQHNTKAELVVPASEIKSGEALLSTEGQRKKRKLEPIFPEKPDDRQHEALSTTTPGRSSRPTGRLEPGEHLAQKVQPPKALQTVQKTVSPPPARRKPAASVAKDNAIQPKPTRKAESLNPRMLGHSPATHDIRYKLLKLLHENFVRLNSELAKDANADEKILVLSDQDLIFMALDLEEQVARDKPIVYTNVLKNKVLSYKRMNVSAWKSERKAEYDKLQATIAAKKPTINASEIQPREICTGLSPDQELKLLPRLYTDISGLTKHGYVNSIPTTQQIATANSGIEAAKGWEVCDRCKSRFQVFPGRREEDGALTSGGKCTYHWARMMWQDKDPKNPKAERQKKYKCCGEAVGDSNGCVQSETHVFKVSEVKRLAALLNFEETPENEEVDPSLPVCIDCEMGYTVYGLELVRLTATRWPSGEELLDVLVRPVGEILDLNSRFSGVWPQQMADAIPYEDNKSNKPGTGDDSKKIRIVASPAAARSLLFRHLAPGTPVIGHGLENDLNATRFIHPTIIDTVLLYPHKSGLPFRHGLKALMYMHLKRHIQVVGDGKMEGHDSKEDANAAGDLVRFAIRREWEKMQREGWTWKDGELIAPTGTVSGAISADYFTQQFGSDMEDVMATSKKRTLEEADM